MKSLSAATQGGERMSRWLDPIARRSPRRRGLETRDGVVTRFPKRTGVLRAVLSAGMAAALSLAASACETSTPPSATPTTDGHAPSTSIPSDPGALDRLRDAIESGDAAQVASCFTADFRAELPQHPERNFVGAKQVRANWTAIFSSSPHLAARVLRTAVNGPEIWSEWEMADLDKPGTPVVFAGPVILTTRDGKINWVRFYLDPVGPLPG